MFFIVLVTKHKGTEKKTKENRGWGRGEKRNPQHYKQKPL
jgi:hypothetical protein